MRRGDEFSRSRREIQNPVGGLDSSNATTTFNPLDRGRDPQTRDDTTSQSSPKTRRSLSRRATLAGRAAIEAVRREWRKEYSDDLESNYSRDSSLSRDQVLPETLEQATAQAKHYLDQLATHYQHAGESLRAPIQDAQRYLARGDFSDAKRQIISLRTSQDIRLEEKYGVLPDSAMSQKEHDLVELQRRAETALIKATHFSANMSHELPANQQYPTNELPTPEQRGRPASLYELSSDQISGPQPRETPPRYNWETWRKLSEYEQDRTRSASESRPSQAEWSPSSAADRPSAFRQALEVEQRLRRASVSEEAPDVSGEARRASNPPYPLEPHEPGYENWVANQRAQRLNNSGHERSHSVGMPGPSRAFHWRPDLSDSTNQERSRAASTGASPRRRVRRSDVRASSASTPRHFPLDGPSSANPAPPDMPLSDRRQTGSESPPFNN